MLLLPKAVTAQPADAAPRASPARPAYFPEASCSLFRTPPWLRLFSPSTGTPWRFASAARHPWGPAQWLSEARGPHPLFVRHPRRRCRDPGGRALATSRLPLPFPTPEEL